MDRKQLTDSLEELKQKSINTLDQATQYDNAAQNMREEALMIKGEYRTIERILANWVDEPKEDKLKKGKDSATSSS